MKIRKFYGLVFLVLLSLTECKKKDDAITPIDTKKVDSPLTNTLDGKFLTDWTNLHLNLIKNTAGYMSPVAARSLAYTSLATYESLRPGMPGYISMAGQLNGFSSVAMPDSTKEYNWALVATTAQYTVLKELFISSGDKNQRLIDSVRNVYELKYKSGLNDAAIQNSIRHGAALAISVLEYSKKDGGADGSLNNFPKSYVIPSGVGAWKPTSTQKIPLLPTWGKNRTFLSSNAEDGIVDVPMLFSFLNSSEYFKEVKKLLGQNLLNTTEQKKTAEYYENGLSTITITGQLFNVMTSIAKEKSYKLDQLAVIYLKTSLALSDANVSCWKSKYQNNILRPQTFVNEAIDKNWKPLLETPPSPEYPSEHAMAAGAFSAIMESEFGKTVSFIDNTYEGKYPNRSFKALENYISEISSSRVYAGVHYSLSCTAGEKAGKKIGANVLKLKIKK
jgi:PAP2 superfamily